MMINSRHTHYLICKEHDDNAVDDVHTPKFLNTITTLRLPNHKLRLKVRVSMMLLKNIDKKNSDYAMTHFPLPHFHSLPHF